MNRLPRRHSRLFIGLGVAIVLLATMVGGWVVLAAAPLVFQQHVATPGAVEAEPRSQSATTDDEWLALIEKAKQMKASGEWPEPDTSKGGKIVYTCAEAPHGMLEKPPSGSMSIEDSPDGSRHRVVFFLGNVAVILYSDRDLSGCPERVKEIVRNRPPALDGSRKHICEQMRVMAQGQPKTDVTLRDASPRVAQAYLEAFCQSLSTVPSPPATQGPR